MYAEFIHANALGQTLMNGPEMWVHRKAEWVSNVVEGTWESRTIDELAPQRVMSSSGRAGEAPPTTPTSSITSRKEG